MRSSNRQIKSAFNALLSDIGYPVYSNFVPAHVDPAAYILLSGIADTDASSMGTNDTDVSISVGIYTKENIANSGDLCDLMAEGVYQRILPNPQAVIDLSPDFQNTVLKKVSDQSTVLQLNSFVAINRTIIFRLQILHK